jgi:hypothetical protein
MISISHWGLFKTHALYWEIEFGCVDGWESLGTHAMMTTEGWA